jgi:hypothetical protein
MPTADKRKAKETAKPKPCINPCYCCYSYYHYYHDDYLVLTQGVGGRDANCVQKHSAT